MDRDIRIDALLKPPAADYPWFAGSEAFDACRRDLVGYDSVDAWLLAEASMLAYVRDETVVRDALARLGFERVSFYHGDGAQGFLAQNADHAWLVFRGTEPDDLHDILADLQFALVPTEGEKGLVHRGFEQALNSVWPEIEVELSSLGQRCLFVAGHSLGAALALLAGFRLGSAHAVYTYGAPRVGTAGFRDAYPSPVYRVVNNNDLVTLIPPPILYRHVGETCFIHHDGHIGDEPSTFKIAESRLLGHIDHASEVIRRWRNKDYNAIPNSNLVDHAPVNYVKPLRAAVFDA